MRNQAHLSYLLPLFARFSIKSMWVRGILHCWHTEDFSVRWQETELPDWSACLINNTRGSGHTMHLIDSKCGPQSLSPRHTSSTQLHALSCSHTLSCVLYTRTQTLHLCFSSFLSLSPMIKKQYPAYNCKLVRHPHSFAVKGKWPWWWVIAFTQRLTCFIQHTEISSRVKQWFSPLCLWVSSGVPWCFSKIQKEKV